MNITHELKCERCEKLIDGSYGSGRFCDISCARAWAAVQNLETARVQRSITQKGRKGRPLTQELQDKMQAGRLQSKLNKNVIIGDRHKPVHHTLDITYAYLYDYRKEHIVCEICKKPESIIHRQSQNIRKLAIDHDHETRRFRGLLCTKCNMNFDWYVANAENILKYASK